MASLVEIQEGARAYREFFEAQHAAKALQPPLADLEQKRREVESLAYQALQGVDAEGLLQAVANEVWKEVAKVEVINGS